MSKHIISPSEQARAAAPSPSPAAASSPPREVLGRSATWGLLATLGALVAINVPSLGSDPWPFEGRAEARGLLAPLVRAAEGTWDPDIPRTAAVLAGLLIALAAAATWRLRSWRPTAALALTLCVVGLVVVPATLLQVGLRHGSEPWLHTNDSTYQIELAGRLAGDGENPYGYDYRTTGLARWYPAAGFEPSRRQVALEHFAYFPGTVYTATVWDALPAPLDDYRVFVLLTTLAAFFAVLLFRAPLAWKLALGAVVAANPLAVRAAWFGTADAPSVLCLVLAFAFVTRSRYIWAAVALAAAVLLKQFALVALPFLGAMLVVRGARRETLVKAGAAFAGVLAAGALPFLIVDPGAMWDDTVAYGAGTYRIVGYGLAGLLVKAGAIDGRFDPYPFTLLALLVWLPLTAWLVWNQLRDRALWLGAAGFTVSIFVLIFLGRVFQHSYLVWPLTGIALAGLLAASERAERNPA